MKFLPSFLQKWSQQVVHLRENPDWDVVQACQYEEDQERDALLGCEETVAGWDFTGDWFPVSSDLDSDWEHVLAGVDPPWEQNVDEDCEWHDEHDSFVDLSVESRWLFVDSQDFEFFDPVFENEVECENW